ncbi:glycoside hydrolase family 76 protein [Paraflavitalea sp. CAU 1676]|uniref:glycoside hydrolase family 76 protein n=1 Tax=Paraflavitalea sp. CAU 1676 TaxID=3032598 RepID=UPI0023DBDDB0|nr:glycoside hydrolase family 76 protein [Paraflavitalea sp. CAU 1676]MDF2189678.1 glycoside hydrolase family 76 protein [Paraflavitalea sp. CAU 1676]
MHKPLLKRRHSLILLRFSIIAAVLAGCNKPQLKEEEAPAASDQETQTLATIANPLADQSFSALNNAFLYTSGNTQYYKEALNNAQDDYFWRQALEIQMVEDVYLRTKNPAHRTLITNLLNTFLQNEQGSGGLYDWNWNEYNDDLLWAGIAFARGYHITGNTTFLNQAKYAFNRVYDRGWDNALGGGIWWDIRKNEKSGLSNNPAVVLALYIYEASGETVYMTKATAIYDWIWATLYNQSTGAVYEHIKANGTKAMDANAYNVGAFVSAATALHRLTGRSSVYDDAKRSVDYIVLTQTNNGIMTNGQRDGTWQSEFARGIGEFVRDNNMWGTYWDWMRRNANAAWSRRRTDLNISWNNWTNNMPVDNVARSLECIGTVVMLNVTPVALPGFSSGATFRITPKINEASALDVVAAGTANLTKTDIWGYYNAAHQRWTLTSQGRGYYRITPTHATGMALDVNGASTANNADAQIYTWNNGGTSQLWKLVYDYDGYYKLKPKCAPLNSLNVAGNNPANGTRCLMWKESNGDNERWLLQ